MIRIVYQIEEKDNGSGVAEPKFIFEVGRSTRSEVQYLRENDVPVERIKETISKALAFLDDYLRYQGNEDEPD